MSEVPAAPPATVQPLPPGQSFVGRFVGVLTSPKATFADVAARPRWFGMIAALIIVGIVGGTALMATDVGRLAALDAARNGLNQVKSLGISMPPEAEARMEREIMEMPLWRMGLNASLGQIVGGVLLPLCMAGVFLLIFNVMLGGEATFKQMFATVVHANPVMLVGVLFTMPLMYFRGSMTGVTNLGVFVPMLDESSFVAKLLGSVDLIRVWWVIVLATGLSVLYKRKTGPIATALLVVYGIYAVIIAAVTAGRAGA
jgi:hypothetical protein